jgi:dephospho-CoA kinase
MLIGITGGIGSGKTSVCKLLESNGFPVYYSDDRAKWLMEYDKEVKQQLIDLFGTETFQNQTLNRPFLAKQIFEDSDKRAKVNAIVHPAVAKDFQLWYESQTAMLVFKESALLFETGIYQQTDFNVLITASVEERINRVVERDGVDRKQIEARINAQMSDEQKIPLADYIIQNTNHSDLNSEVKKLLMVLQSKSLN